MACQSKRKNAACTPIPEHVIVGADSFAEPADGFEDFARAMREKLCANSGRWDRSYILTLRCQAQLGLEGPVDADTDASRLALLTPQHEG